MHNLNTKYVLHQLLYQLHFGHNFTIYIIYAIFSNNVHFAIHFNEDEFLLIETIKMHPKATKFVR